MEMIILLIPAIVIVAVIILFKKRTSDIEYKPKHFRDNTYDTIKKQVDQNGLKIKGKLRIGVNKISDVNKWLLLNGNFDNMEYDIKLKKYIDAKPVEFKLIVLKSDNKNIIFKLLNLFNQYYILNQDSIKHFDDLTNTWILNDNENIISYGNTWINSDQSMEYINNLAILRSMESIMTQLENFPDKMVLLEVLQAKRNQLLRADTENTKAKYDSIKRMDDTYVG